MNTLTQHDGVKNFVHRFVTCHCQCHIQLIAAEVTVPVTGFSGDFTDMG